MSITKTVRVTLNKKSVIDQFPEIVVKHNYLETDIFEDGLVYGSDTIRKEPPLNKWLYTFPKGARIMYLGQDHWKLEASIDKKDAIQAALRKIVPVIRNYL